MRNLALLLMVATCVMLTSAAQAQDINCCQCWNTAPGEACTDGPEIDQQWCDDQNVANGGAWNFCEYHPDAHCEANLCIDNLDDDECSKCSFELGGPDWLETCVSAEPGYYMDDIPTSDLWVGVDLGDDCVSDTELHFGGSFTIQRGLPAGGTIPIESLTMSLTAEGGLTLRAGSYFGLEASGGAILQAGPGQASASINVFFEIEYAPGLYGYNRIPLTIVTSQDFDCIPPNIHLEAPKDTCIPIYETPVGDPEDVPVGRVTVAGETGILAHDPYAGDIPTVSQWGLAALTLLVLAAGTVVLRRQRALAV